MTSKTLRRIPAGLAALAVALGAGAANGGTHARPAERTAPARPNIVFVLTDDLAWNLVRYMPSVQAMHCEVANQ